MTAQTSTTVAVTTTITPTSSSLASLVHIQEDHSNLKDPTFYPDPATFEESSITPRPTDTIDYRSKGGPWLQYLWEPSHELRGQDLYLGSELSADGKYLFHIPGSADRVHRIDLQTNECTLIGPKMPGKYKWLRGISIVGKNSENENENDDEYIYGIPCHADTVLQIHVPTQTIRRLKIPFEEFYNNNNNNNNNPDLGDARTERMCKWKYHGGAVSPVDGCIYCIPQSAKHVLKINPVTHTCTFVPGPFPLLGKYKWYGGIVGKQDNAIYGIPHNSPHVLRILPTSNNNNNDDDNNDTVQITLHGDFGPGGHKWHGAAAARNGTIVCVPANADTVLCIYPANPEPKLLELTGENDGIIKAGRHRTDNKYKFLGATGCDANGKVYCFPCAAERVIEVDPSSIEEGNPTVRAIGPNIYDSQMERICQNKWQNGVYLPDQQVVLGIPLAAESLLMIDTRTTTSDEPIVTTWPLPEPYRKLAKWEGGIVTPAGIVYCVPNNFKAALRIELPNTNDHHHQQQQQQQQVNNQSEQTTTTPAAATTTTSGENSENGSNSSPSSDNQSNNKQQQPSTHNRNNDRPDYSQRTDLVYKSGIPTLRSSAHRVKFNPKNRIHDPKPKDRNGNETKTLSLPSKLMQEDVFDFDKELYTELTNALVSLLKRCDPNVVGAFRDPNSERLEDFEIPTQSTWRSVNGGQCEEAQKYLSDQVAADEDFLSIFDKVVQQAALPYLKQRLCSVEGCGVKEDEELTFYYQRPPTLRFQPGPAWAQVKAHNDAEYGHQNGELNFWLPFTNRNETQVDLWCETEYNVGDYHPIVALPGQMISFHGSSCRHYVNANATQYTRVSMDFRIGVQGFFDPYWQMKGTSDDHGRKEVSL